MRSEGNERRSGRSREGRERWNEGDKKDQEVRGMRKTKLDRSNEERGEVKEEDE